MKLHYNKTGTGFPLFILHGLYGSGDNWLNIARELSKYFSVFLVDQRNHGSSPKDHSHTYDDLSADLKELLSTLEIKECYLIGHSMGGKTAMTFALKYPGIVKKLVIVDITPFSYLDQDSFSKQSDFHKNILKTFAEAPLDQITSRPEMETFFAQRIHDLRILKFLLKNLKRNKSSKFEWKINVQALQSNLNAIIDAIPPVKFGVQSYIPSLFIKGGKSPYISNEDIQAIPDVFTNFTLITFENSGHWLHSEEPERFIEIVTNFLLS